MNRNIPEFTVSEFSRSIKQVVENSFGYLRIKGEITGFKRATSGHLYFTLKHENSALSAVCFRGSAQNINFEIADGLQVCASGKITTFEGRSNYQIIVERLEIAGVGAILEMLEKRKQKLLEEGLFDEIHKKPIPFFPKKIGVITSETGAVIEDIKHRIEARCPTHLLVFSTLVQGEKSASQIIEAIKYFNRLKNEKRPDLIIIARGGGSFEDLMPFNDEFLVREVFKSEIPIISAVGHETDTTLIDYVSDLRAPTPTAAAELATPVLSNIKNRLAFLEEKLEELPKFFFNNSYNHLRNLQRYVASPAKTLEQIREKFIRSEDKFEFFIKNYLAKSFQKIDAAQISDQRILQRIGQANQSLNYALDRLKLVPQAYFKEMDLILKNLSKSMKSHHYNEILKRGFSLIKNNNGELVSSISNLNLNEILRIEMGDGSAEIELSKKINLTK
jgi:exodeoxyribonuclease VII large subunit